MRLPAFRSRLQLFLEPRPRGLARSVNGAPEWRSLREVDMPAGLTLDDRTAGEAEE